MKKVCALALSLAVLAIGSSAAAETALVRFSGGIGVIPVSNAAGVQNPGGTFPDVTRNDVRGVQPGGQPWVISQLEATVKTDGRISVNGRGLLLGGGNGVGTTADQSVRARLFCGTLAHDSELVPLAPSGDFRIDGALDPLPVGECETPVLLIVSANNRWFAAGILRP